MTRNITLLGRWRRHWYCNRAHGADHARLRPRRCDGQLAGAAGGLQEVGLRHLSGTGPMTVSRSMTMTMARSMAVTVASAVTVMLLLLVRRVLVMMMLQLLLLRERLGQLGVAAGVRGL